MSSTTEFSMLQMVRRALPDNGGRSSASGFTLVELLIVILIIGILLAIALPTFLSQQDKANDADTKQALNTAYKVAKSEAATNEGSFTGTGAMVAAINASEPELTADHQAAPVNATTDAVSVISSGDGGFCAAKKSQTGTIFSLVVNDRGAPEYVTDGTCEPSVVSNPSGGPGGGSGSTIPALVYVETVPGACKKCGDAYTVSLKGVSASGTGTQTITNSFGLAGQQYYGPAISPQAVQGTTAYGVDPGGNLTATNLNTGATTVAAGASALCDGMGISISSSGAAVASAGSGKLAILCPPSSGPSLETSVVVVDTDGSNAQTIVPSSSGVYLNSLSSNSSGMLAYFAVDSSGPTTTVYVVPSTGGSPQSVGGTVDLDHFTKSYAEVAIAGDGSVYATKNSIDDHLFRSPGVGQPFTSVGVSAFPSSLRFNQAGTRLAYMTPTGSAGAEFHVRTVSSGATTTFTPSFIAGGQVGSLLWTN